MGIDYHGTRFLQYCHVKYGSFEKCVTFGRQTINIRAGEIPELQKYVDHKWSEPFLQEKFGASEITSLDVSRYQGASIIHDLNVPIPNNLFELYDTVIDLGCSEHIMNVFQAMQNASDLCKVGGTIIHVVPANNYCGHGFWQFSPILLYEFYSRERGFKDTEVFLSSPEKKRQWFKVLTNNVGKRLVFRSSCRVYAMVVTKKIGIQSKKATTNQPDYLDTWNKNLNKSPPYRGATEAKRRNELIFQLKRIKGRLLDFVHRKRKTLHRSNPHLEHIKLDY